MDVGHTIKRLARVYLTRSKQLDPIQIRQAESINAKQNVKKIQRHVETLAMYLRLRP